MENVVKATREHTKFHNISLVLREVYFNDAISRADIARITKLTPGTVSEIVSQLLTDNYVEEIGYGDSKGGKPPTLLSFNKNARQIITLDLSSDEFHGAVVNLTGDILYSTRNSFFDHIGEEAIQKSLQMIDDLKSHAEMPILGIGVGAPGVIDINRGVVIKGVKLGWNNLDVREIIENEFSIPTIVANDSHVAALAELVFGDYQKEINLVLIKIEDGIGAGIIIDGKILIGDGYGAGEIGHIQVVEDGAKCRCGHIGCLETVASSRAIIEYAIDAYKDRPNKSKLDLLSNEKALNISDLFSYDFEQDSFVVESVARAGKYLGKMIANITGLLNINNIVLTGSVANFGSALTKPMAQHFHSSTLKDLVSQTNIQVSKLGPDIVLLGAAALVIKDKLGII